MMKVRIRNASLLFEKPFELEVRDKANWLALDGCIICHEQSSLQIRVGFSVEASVKDALGNKYDGYLFCRNQAVSPFDVIDQEEYDFVEEDDL